MNNVTTGIALFAIIAVLVAYLISRSKNVDRVIRAAEQRQEDSPAARDEAARLRMIYEAACETSPKPAPTSEEQAESRKAFNRSIANGVNTDEYRRRLNAGMTNHRAASMEPFCGEGKKP